MNKPTIFLDYDGVIVDSIRAITTLIAVDYINHPEYKHVPDIRTWDFEELQPLIPRHVINSYFEDERFFKVAEFMPNAKEYIEILSRIFTIRICTIGSEKNIELKKIWLKENLPFITEYNFITIPKGESIKMDKSSVDMSSKGNGGRNTIFIDDNGSNLETSNADTVVCYGKNLKYNEEWTGLRANKWSDIVHMCVMHSII